MDTMEGRETGLQLGLQGRLTTHQLPFAMGDLYRPDVDGRWWWKDCDTVSVTYLTPAEAAAAVLPSEFSLPHTPHMPMEGMAAATLVFAKYRGGTLGPYNEVFLAVPCRYQGQSYLYVPVMYVTTGEALAAGRELSGFPKKPATIALDVSDAQFTGSLERHGVQLASLSFTQGKELCSVPLPAQERVVVPSPFDQVLGLPEPSGAPQGLPFRTASTRYLPTGLSPHHIETRFRYEQGTFWAGKGRIEYASLDDEPLAKLPVVGVVASTLFKGDFAFFGGQLLAQMA